MPSAFALVYRAAYLVYAICHALLLRSTPTNNPHWIFFRLTVIGLILDNSYRFLCSLLISGPTASTPTTTLSLLYRWSCSTYWMHNCLIAPLLVVSYEVYRVLDSSNLLDYDKLLDYAKLLPTSAITPQTNMNNIGGRLFVYILAASLSAWGAWDCLAGTRPCSNLRLQFRYGDIALIRHPLTPGSLVWQQPAMISILLTCLAWLTLAIWFGRRFSNWQPLGVFITVFLLFGLMTPPTSQAPDSLWTFVKWVGGNGAEVMLMWAILGCIKKCDDLIG